MEALVAKQLPVELILDVLELLLASPDKESRRAAFALVQTCKALRSSEAGEKLRYANARSRLSVTVSNKQPVNFEYEFEVLANSAWPLRAPVQPDPCTSERVASACLRGSEIFALSLDRKQIQCFTCEPVELDPQPAPPTVQPERHVLRRVIAFDARVAYFAVDEDADYCVVVYGEQVKRYKPGDVLSPQSIEVRCLRTGDLALPGDRGKMDIDASDERVVSAIEMAGNYVLLRYVRRGKPVGVHVLRWRTALYDPSPFPIIISQPTSQGDIGITTNLLSANYVSIISRAQQHPHQTFRDTLHIHQLVNDSSLPLATFKMPIYKSKAVTEPYISCGAKIAPGESGMCWISTAEHARLIDIVTLSNILTTASESGRPVDLDEAWVRKHTYTHFPSEQTHHGQPARAVVSGWRSVGTTWDLNSGEMTLNFCDVSPNGWTDAALEFVGPYTESWWKCDSAPSGFHVFTTQHSLERYCESQDLISSRRSSIQFDGARMLLCSFAENDPADGANRPLFHMSTWRM